MHLDANGMTSPADRLFMLHTDKDTCIRAGSFLLYTAIVTPAVISFHWLDGECASSPTLYFDW